MSLDKKLKGFIFSILMINSSLNTSFASTVPSYNRYESFNGDSVHISDLLEEDTLDVEIGGNTLVNILNYNNVILDSGWTYDNLTHTGITSRVDELGYFRGVQFTSNKTIESNKKYTLYVDITKNTLKNNKTESVAKVGFLDDSHGSQTLYIKPGETGVVKHVFESKRISHNLSYLTITPNAFDGEFEFKDFMIIEGDHTDKDLSFFTGMKSVNELENSDLEVSSIGENLFDVEYFKNMIESNYGAGNYGYEIKDGRNTIWVNNDHRNIYLKSMINNNYKFKENKRYIVKGSIYLDPNNQSVFNTLRGSIEYTDGSSTPVLDATYQQGVWLDTSILSVEGKNITDIIFSYGERNSKGWFDLDSLYIGEYIEGKTDYNMSYQNTTHKITLDEPLRKAYNDAYDRIIKEGNQWKIERNLKQYVVDGSENWVNDGIAANNAYDTYRMMYNFTPLKDNRARILSDKFPFKTSYTATSTSGEGIFGSLNGTTLYIDIKKDKIDSLAGSNIAEKFKKWLSLNPVTIVFQTGTPTVEYLSEDFLLPQYKNYTCVYTNSSIPAQLKFNVDRVANLAKEACEFAIIHPTVESLSQARYWTNLMKESLLKDEFAESINEITDITDLRMDKKTVSANADIYIKMKNSLSLSLDTNSIVFNDVDSTEDFERKNAINLTITSSLPYKINSYLESEIYNLEQTMMIDKSMLNIKANSDNTYKAFSDINTPIILLDEQPSGAGIVHGIDLKINPLRAIKTDIYKTSLKFEVEQK